MELRAVSSPRRPLSRGRSTNAGSSTSARDEVRKAKKAAERALFAVSQAEAAARGLHRAVDEVEKIAWPAMEAAWEAPSSSSRPARPASPPPRAPPRLPQGDYSKDDFIRGALDFLKPAQSSAATQATKKNVSSLLDKLAAKAELKAATPLGNITDQLDAEQVSTNREERFW